MTYGKSREDRVAALLDRFYLDDDGVTIRRRAAEVSAMAQSALSAERHKAYAKMLNRHAHKPIGVKGDYVRVYGVLEMRRDDATALLRLSGDRQRQPMQVVAPKTLWPAGGKLSRSDQGLNEGKGA